MLVQHARGKRRTLARELPEAGRPCAAARNDKDLWFALGSCELNAAKGRLVGSRSQVVELGDALGGKDLVGRSLAQDASLADADHIIGGLLSKVNLVQ